jgi:hypothetical protein
VRLILSFLITSPAFAQDIGNENEEDLKHLPGK